MKVKITRAVIVNGQKSKKGDLMDISPKIATKLILRGYASTEWTEEPMSYAPDQPFSDAKDDNKSSE